MTYNLRDTALIRFVSPVSFFRVSLFLIAFFLCVAPASAITNPSFESGSAGWTVSYPYTDYAQSVNFYDTGSFDDSGYVRTYARAEGCAYSGRTDRSEARVTQINVDCTGKDVLHFKARAVKAGARDSSTYCTYSNSVLVAIGGCTKSITSSSWSDYTIDVSGLTGEQTLYVHSYATVYTSNDYGAYSYAYGYFDDFYFDDGVTIELSSSSVNASAYDNLEIYLTTLRAGGHTLLCTLFSESDGDYTFLDTNCFGVASDSEITDTVFNFTVPECDHICVHVWDDDTQEEITNLTVDVFFDPLYYYSNAGYEGIVYDYGSYWDQSAYDSGVVDYFYYVHFDTGTRLYYFLDDSSGTENIIYPGYSGPNVTSVDLYYRYDGMSAVLVDSTTPGDTSPEPPEEVPEEPEVEEPSEVPEIPSNPFENLTGPEDPLNPGGSDPEEPNETEPIEIPEPLINETNSTTLNSTWVQGYKNSVNSTVGGFFDIVDSASGFVLWPITEMTSVTNGLNSSLSGISLVSYHNILADIMAPFVASAPDWLIRAGDFVLILVVSGLILRRSS